MRYANNPIEIPTEPEPVIAPEPPRPIGPPRTDLDGLVDAWNAAVEGSQDEFLRRIGCRVHSRVMQSWCVDTEQLVRRLG
jgi:hypothetical protein